MQLSVPWELAGDNTAVYCGTAEYGPRGLMGGQLQLPVQRLGVGGYGIVSVSQLQPFPTVSVRL